MAVNDLFHVRTDYLCDEQLCSFGMGFKQTAGPDLPSACSNLVTGWSTAIRAAFLAMVGAKTKLSAMRAYRIAPAPMVPAIGHFDESSDVGSYAGENHPSNVSILVLLRTDHASGRHNGRIYLSGITETVVTGGDIDSTWLAGVFTTFLAAALADVVNTGQTFKPQVIQRSDSGGPLTPPVGNNIVAAHASTRVSGLRGRTSREIYVP